jgi:hypothetical protein
VAARTEGDAGGRLNPRPFEIHLKVPAAESPQSQAFALRSAFHSILSGYREVISHALHI